MYFSYLIGLLRGVAALPLFASLIQDRKSRQARACPVRPLASGRDGLGTQLFDAADSGCETCV